MDRCNSKAKKLVGESNRRRGVGHLCLVLAPTGFLDNTQRWLSVVMSSVPTVLTSVHKKSRPVCSNHLFADCCCKDLVFLLESRIQVAWDCRLMLNEFFYPVLGYI